VASGKEITVLRGHGDAVFPIAFSPDGQMLATGSADKTARLWEVATGEEIAVLRGHENDVGSVAFSPDGRMLATGSKDNTARLWPVGQYLVNLACARVNGLPLSERDKERFGITDEWCAPEVSGALRAKLGVDQSDTAHPPVIAR
jgi:WD40 repeat protein